MRSWGRWRRAAVGLAAVAVLAAGVGGASGAEPGPDPRLDDPTTYPARGFGDIKGIQPDGWPPDELPGLGAVPVNFAWDHWEPTVDTPPCAPQRVEFDGRCFVVPAPVDQAIQEYTVRGVHVAGIFWGTPAWARTERPCVPFMPNLVRFCMPDDPADFARFAGFVADRYDGAHGEGRVVDFVVWNEVNTSMWFNTGCGSTGIPCELDAWVADYASLYNPAYDRIRAAQPRARVMFSFTNLLAAELDEPTGSFPSYSMQTFVPPLVELVGPREWSIALHPYPTNLAGRIDARDYPYATLGSVGALPGWLHASYPDDPHAWEVQITEVGFHNTPALYDQVDRALCDSFRNVLGTPGITSFLYHRLRDQAGEQGLLLGLVDLEGNPKPAYDLWRGVNDPDDPRCGFELDGRTLVRLGVDPDSGARWYSSRVLPAGYEPQPGGWSLAWAEEPGTALLFECADAAVAATWLSRSAACGGGIPMGPVGWIATGPGPGLKALWECNRTVTTTTCPGGTLLGYVSGDIGDPPTSTTSTTTTLPGTGGEDLLLQISPTSGVAGTVVEGTVDVARVADRCADTVPEAQEGFRDFRQAVEALADEFGGAGQLLPPYQDQTHAAYSMLWALGVGVGSDRGYAELALEQTHVLAFVEDASVLVPLGPLGGFDPATGQGQVTVPDLDAGEWPVLAACVSPSASPDRIREAVAAGAAFLDGIGFDPAAPQGAEFLTFLQEIAPDLLMPVVEVDGRSEASFCVEPCADPPGPPSPPPARPVTRRPTFTG